MNPIDDTVGCTFCDIDGFRRHSTLIVENDLCLFANHDDDHEQAEGFRGYLRRGSGLIVPRRHCPTAFDLSAEEGAAVHELLARIRPVLDDRYHPAGYTLAWNCHPVAGQAVDHAHLHVLPRYHDEPHAGRGIRWLLRQPNRHP